MLLLQVLSNSFVLSTEVLLLGAGLFLTNSVSRVLNVGLTGAILIGGYTYYLFAPLGIFWAMIITIIVSAIFGMINYLLLRPFIENRQPLLALLSGVALWISVKAVTAITFGSDGKFLWDGVLPTVTILGLTIRVLDIFMVLFTFASIGIGAVVLYLLPAGRRLRACSQHPHLINLIGISEKKIQMWCFVICSTIAGIDGVFIGMRDALTPATGHGSLVYAFIALFVGGLGSFKGFVVATFLLFLPSQLLVNGAFGFDFGSDSWVMAIYFIMAFILLLIRPRGLFTKTTRSA